MTDKTTAEEVAEAQSQVEASHLAARLTSMAHDLADAERNPETAAQGLGDADLADLTASIQDMRTRLGLLERELTTALGRRLGKTTGNLTDGRQFTLGRSADRKEWDHAEWKRDARREVTKATTRRFMLAALDDSLVDTETGEEVPLAQVIQEAVTMAQEVHGSTAPRSTALKALGLYASDYATSTPSGWRFQAIKPTPAKPEGQPMAEAAKKTAATKTAAKTPADTWAALTAPFPDDWVERLPKPVSRQDQSRAKCEPGSRVSADGHHCGGYHSRAVHLDYVGHAGITMRLNDVLGPGGWDFQPMAYGAEGLPLISRDAFWGKLTVTVDGETVTKWELATGFNSLQEALGDALRRCAMRMGMGTYLWSKSDHSFNLAQAQEEPTPEPTRAPTQEPPPRQEPPQGQEAPSSHGQMVLDRIQALTGDDAERVRQWYNGRRYPEPLRLSAAQAGEVWDYLDANVGHPQQDPS